ncbi:MAG: hypothetical protein CISAcid_07560 [uncultured Acidilobus sp. CIS]|nr:MAG: hypothetical protein CISAcid_07560 [uncultured Acidilobus sp. CIS]
MEGSRPRARKLAMYSSTPILMASRLGTFLTA